MKNKIAKPFLKWADSDVKGKDSSDNFFDEFYSDFPILRVNAKRSINANPDFFYLDVIFGRAFLSNFLLVPYKMISTLIPNTKLVA